ncbi:hypothetical protein KKA13_00545 [Patescibacteria group bacterium]|nr:hypothetical protein [Patescibacteria group bacterium]
MEIRLDFLALPEEFFIIPATSKVRETIRELLIYGYKPSEIATVISKAFPGLNFTTEAIMKFRYFFWDIGDLMDTAEGQAALQNKLKKIRSDILGGKNFLQHIEQLKAVGKTADFNIIKTLQKKFENDWNNDLTTEDKHSQYWVATPFFESDDKQQFRPWLEFGQTEPMASFVKILNILDGHLDLFTYALSIGIVPPQFLDLESLLQKYFTIITARMYPLLKTGSSESLATYIKDIFVPFTHSLRALAISPINQRNSVIDSVHPIYQTFEDFPDIVEEKK